MDATMTSTVETLDPHTRRPIGTTVSGDEATRLVGLGLAEYNEVEPAVVTATPASQSVTEADELEQEES
jgi:hypothetical protein